MSEFEILYKGTLTGIDDRPLTKNKTQYNIANFKLRNSNMLLMLHVTPRAGD